MTTQMTFDTANMARHVGAGDGSVLGGASWRLSGLETVGMKRTLENFGVGWQFEPTDTDERASGSAQLIRESSSATQLPQLPFSG